MITKTPINEYSTLVQKSLLEGGGSYTEIGGGINYQKDDGSFDVANPAIVASTRTGINWECYTTHNRVGFKTNISTGVYSVFSQIGNTGKILKSKPVGIAYLNIDTKEYQIFANLQSSVGVVSGNTIRYNDAFLNCDLEYVILKDRLKQNLHIKSKAGFPASPYAAAKTYVVVVTTFDLANFELPTLVDERGTTSFNDSGDDTDGELRFSDQVFEMSMATDNAGATQAIKKRLVNVSGNYYYLEGLPYQWLVSASYPVLLDYTTISSAFGTATWSSGTYYISASVDQNQNSLLTVSSGVVIKLAASVNLKVNGIAINGSAGTPVYMTSMNDDTVGETITGSSGSPAAGNWGSFQFIYWNNQGNSSCNIAYLFSKYGTIGWGSGGYTAINHTINNSIFKYFTNAGVYFNSGTNSVNDSQFNTCVTGVAPSSTSTTTANRCLFINNTSSGFGAGNYYRGTLNNCTLNGNGIGIYGSQSESVFTANNCIITNNTTGVSAGSGSITLNYCLRYGNTSAGTATADNNPITPANPNFATGTAATGYLGDMTYFLNQSTSPCKDAGSDTAANLGMNTYTTAADKTTDSGTVDIGYHYTVADVGTSGGTAYTKTFTDDAIASTDTIGRGIGKSPTDAITSSDGLGKGSARALSDSASFAADTIKKAVARGFLDAATLSDIFNTASGRGISFSDAITLADSFGYTSGRGLSFSDTIAIADTLLRGMEKKPTDAITSVDALIRAIGRGLSDSISVSDVLSKAAGRNLHLTDTISAIDALLRCVSKNVLDNITSSDSISRTMARSIVDSIISTDALSKAISRIVLESGITFSDTFSASTVTLVIVDIFKSAIAKSISGKGVTSPTIGLDSKVAGGVGVDSGIN